MTRDEYRELAAKIDARRRELVAGESGQEAQKVYGRHGRRAATLPEGGRALPIVSSRPAAHPSLSSPEFAGGAAGVTATNGRG